MLLTFVAIAMRLMVARVFLSGIDSRSNMPRLRQITDPGLSAGGGGLPKERAAMVSQLLFSKKARKTPLAKPCRLARDYWFRTLKSTCKQICLKK
jgi:hypothetical protein